MLRLELDRAGWINLHKLMIDRNATYIKFPIFQAGPDVVQIAVADACTPLATIVDAETVRSTGRPPQYASTVRVPVPGRSGLIAEAAARRPPAPRLVSSSAAVSLTVAFSPRKFARLGYGHVVMTVPRLPAGILTVPMWMVTAAAVPAQTSATTTAAPALSTLGT